MVSAAHDLRQSFCSVCSETKKYLQFHCLDRVLLWSPLVKFGLFQVNPFHVSIHVFPIHSLQSPQLQKDVNIQPVIVCSKVARMSNVYRVFACLLLAVLQFWSGCGLWPFRALVLPAVHLLPVCVRGSLA